MATTRKRRRAAGRGAKGSTKVPSLHSLRSTKATRKPTPAKAPAKKSIKKSAKPAAKLKARPKAARTPARPSKRVKKVSKKVTKSSSKTRAVASAKQRAERLEAVKRAAKRAERLEEQKRVERAAKRKAAALAKKRAEKRAERLEAEKRAERAAARAKKRADAAAAAAAVAAASEAKRKARLARRRQERAEASRKGAEEAARKVEALRLAARRAREEAEARARQEAEDERKYGKDYKHRPRDEQILIETLVRERENGKIDDPRSGPPLRLNKTAATFEVTIPVNRIADQDLIDDLLVQMTDAAEEIRDILLNTISDARQTPDKFRYWSTCEVLYMGQPTEHGTSPEAPFDVPGSKVKVWRTYQGHKPVVFGNYRGAASNMLDSLLKQKCLVVYVCVGGTDKWRKNNRRPPKRRTRNEASRVTIRKNRSRKPPKSRSRIHRAPHIQTDLSTVTTS